MKTFCNMPIPAVCVAVVGAFVLSGCMGAGGRVGYRIPVGNSLYFDDSVPAEGIYGGAAVTPGFYHGDNNGPEKERTFYLGLEWSILFSAGRKEHVMTVLPTAGLFVNPDLTTPRHAPSALTTLGGTIGAGLDIQRRHVGFHSALCGGYYSYFQGYACARGSSRGWLGFDVSGALAAPSNVYEIFSTVGDFLGSGWYYMG